MITLDELRSRMAYNPETGVFTAQVSRGRRKAGSQLGYVKADGYRMIMVSGRWHYAHRLAWLFTTGSMPVDEIDHINGARDDNRFSNLRQATRSQNMMNVAYRGVCLNKKSQKWQSSIRANGSRTYLGSFATEQEALAAYQAAAEQLHGEFRSKAARASWHGLLTRVAFRKRVLFYESYERRLRKK